MNYEAGYFDQNGRCTPGTLRHDVHSEIRRRFLINQSEMDYESIHSRIHKYMSVPEPISILEFKTRAEKILSNLEADLDTRNITKGAKFPFILPKSNHKDIGMAFDDVYLGAIGKAYQGEYPDYEFTNHVNTSLSGKLRIINGSRHDRLIAEMKRNNVVGIYFPCMTEYSVPASIERIGQLPDQFILAGGFDTAAAFIGSPNILLRKDGYPPLLWLSALSSEEEMFSYHFEAYGYNLTFNRRNHFNRAGESWANGVVVLG